MGILDFREIPKANAQSKDSKEKTGISSNLDTFELFCSVFFKEVMQFKIISDVSAGPDQGKDLIVEGSFDDTEPIKWLVSCKHLAHGQNRVNERIEDPNLYLKIKKHDCLGFIAFYSMVATSKLNDTLEGLEKTNIKVKKYYPDYIETDLLNSSAGIQIASRYFPKSLVNHYKQFIKTIQKYKIDDVQKDKSTFYLKGAQYTTSDINDKEQILQAKIRMVDRLNRLETMKAHSIYFNYAIIEIYNLYPGFFKVSDNKNISYNTIKPDWDFYKLFSKCKSREIAVNEFHFICLVFSFWDNYEANRFIEMFFYFSLNKPLNRNDYIEKLKIFNDKKIPLSRHNLTISHLSIILPDELRDLAAKLFLYGNPIS